MSVGEDLHQIFRILPLLAARRRIPIQELITLGGYNRRSDLIRDLERLMMLGVPPYSPADYFDVEITRSEVILHADLNFTRSLSLTPAEWNLLKTVIEEERRVVSDAALSLPVEEANGLLEVLGTVPVHFIESGREAEFRRLIEQSLERNRAIAIRYTNADGLEKEERTLDPWYLLEHNRSRYLIATDRNLKESRIFRLDRIHSMRVLPSPRENSPPSDLNALNRPHGKERRDVRIRFRFPASMLAGLQREFRFQLEEEPAPAGDTGSSPPPDRLLTGMLNASSIDFFRWYLRAYAPFLEILEPEELRCWVLREAEEFPIPELLSE